MWTKLNKDKMFKREILKYLLVTGVIFTIFVVATEEGVVYPDLGLQYSFLNFLPAIVTGASALFGIGQGASQRRRANELEAQNVRPNFRPSAELRENQAMARQQARIGLPDEVYNNQINQIQQNFATGLRQLGSRGNTPYNVNSFVRANNQATANLNAQDAQYRLQGQQNLMSANRALAQEQRMEFQSQMQNYQQNAQNIANLRRAGNQNMFGAISMLGQAALGGVFNGLGQGGSGGGIRATANVNTTPSAGMVNSVPSISAGLQNNYNNLIQNGLNIPQSLPFTGRII